MMIIYSFSYRKQIPPPGPAYDVRHLPNPWGKIAFEGMTGQHLDVQKFVLGDEPSKNTWIARIAMNVVNANWPAVSFGCTGGIHRSVACAEILADIIRSETDVPVAIKHLVLGIEA